MTRRSDSVLSRAALALSLAVSLTVPLSGCMGEEFKRGYLLDERALAQVKPGMSGDQVLLVLGSPSTVSTVGNRTWYYISQTASRPFQFMNERITDQKVTAVYFNNKLKVERTALYGLQDGKIFDFVSRTTPSGGGDLSFVGQLFKGLSPSTFNPFGT